MPSTLRYEDYTIGWICALQVELLAAMFMLDEKHNGTFSGKVGDDNDYIPGTVGGHNVVIVGLPKKSIGNVSAASLVSQMRQSFPNLRYGLMVGIGAGVPGRNLKPDIRLGDVVIGAPADDSDDAQGIIGYELGTETVDGFVKKSWLYPTDRRLRGVLGTIETEAEFSGSHSFLQYLDAFRARPNGQRFLHPGTENDQLYEADDTDRLVARDPRDSQDPVVHYGLIASGDKLIKNAKLRDALRDKYNIFCFEMEAAGLMNTLPVTVIRGICDYADARKNDVWHHYAAATAAAYAKGLLYAIGGSVSGTHGDTKVRTSPVPLLSKISTPDGQQQKVAEKLPFNVRQSIRSEYESKKPEVEKKISSLLGTPWTIEANTDAIYPCVAAHERTSIGFYILRYFSGAYEWLNMSIKRKGLDDLKDELNEICFNHKITLEPLEPGEDDKTFKMCATGYCGCGIGHGNLRILFEKNKFGDNAENATSGLGDALSSV